jgi:hypothetical protein
MKCTMKAILALFLLILSISACKKNEASSDKPILTLSNSSIKRGEPLVVTTDQMGSNVNIRWSVSPAISSTWISATGNKSVILFSYGGAYKITANYFLDSSAINPYDSSSSPVNVSDSIYNDSSVALCNLQAQVPIKVDDQIIISPVSYSDTGLVFLAHTQDFYDNHNSVLDYGTGTDSTVGYKFDFGTVMEYPCGNANLALTPATAVLSIGALTNGTHNLTIELNGVNYWGSITVSEATCTINWNYTSGVLISPLTVQKQ